MNLKRLFKLPTLLFGLGLAALASCALVANGPGSAAPPLPAAAILATIPVGSAPTYLVIASDGSNVFAASSTSLSVIDTSRNVARLKVSIDPNTAGLAVTADAKRALVSNLFALRLAVLDVDAGALVAPLALVGERFTGGFGRMAVRPGGGDVWVVNEVNQVIDFVPLNGSPAQGFDLDMRPTDIAFSADGGTAYVAGCRQECVPGSVAVIDAVQQTAGGYITVGGNPYRVAVAPDGGHLYTTGLADGGLSVVDLSSRSLLQTVTVGAQPTGLAVTRDGASVYVSSQALGTVTAIDASTYAILGSGTAAAMAREVVVSPDGRRLYVSTQDSVVVIDAAALRS